MLDEEHKKLLMRFHGRKGRIRLWFLYIVPIFLAVVGVYDLYIASQIGSLVDMSLFEYLSDWFVSEIDPNKQYSFSGVQLLAMGRYQTGIFLLGMSLWLGLFSFAYWQQKRRDEEVLALLKKHGEVSS